MLAAVITAPGPPEVLEVRDVAIPRPGPHEVLVRVHASALNRADIMQREGRYPPPPDSPKDIPGLEFAGEVASTGERATMWKTGDRVFGLVGGGAHAEFLVAHERTVAAVPASLDWGSAAAVPEAFITAHDALVTQAGLRPGETVLIHAVGSGVGLAAVQLARALGATPYGTSRTPDKLERAAGFGLERGAALSPEPGALERMVRDWTGGAGVDVVLDLVGGACTAASIGAMARKGRLMLVGTLAGGEETIDLRRVLTQRLTIRGTVLRARPLEEKILVTQAFACEVVPWLAAGTLRPAIDSRFPLADIRAAHRRMESNATFGKVVIDVAP
jgi:NADPH2:quinone reductase